MEMILRLLPIFSLLSIGLSLKTSIEIERCSTDTACYIRQSCLVGKSDESKINLVRYKGESLNDNSCDVFMQIRPFSDDIFHIMVQVNSSSEAITAEGVAFKQEIEQFICKDGAETTKNDNNLDIEPYGERRPFEPNFVFCSFLMKSKSGPINQVFSSNDHEPELIFTTSQPNSIKYGMSRDEFWSEVKAAKTCALDIVKTFDWFNDSHVFEKVDNTRSPVNCSFSSTLVVKREKEDHVEDHPDELVCNMNKKWTYKRKNGDKIETEVIGLVLGKQEIVEVSCATLTCSQCRPLKNAGCGGGCIDPTYNSSVGVCATSTCPNNLWRLPNEEMPTMGEMECRRKRTSQHPSDATWYFINTKGGRERETSMASCAKDADCDEHSEIKRACPTDGMCITVDKLNNSLSCRETHQLRRLTDGEIYNATKFSCSIITGMYTDENNIEVPKGSSIYCELKTEADRVGDVAAASAFSAGKIAGAVAGGVATLFLIGLCVFFIGRRVRKYEDDATKADEERRAKKMAAVPNPEFTVCRKYVSDSEKTAWERRNPSAVCGTLKPRADLLLEWDDTTFLQHLVHFNVYSKLGRYAVLINLTAFNEYAIGERPERVPGKKNGPSEHFGNLKQFFTLWKKCTGEMLDCWITWEYMWRFMKLLYDYFIVHDDSREIGKKMVKLVAEFARPMLTELTYKMRELEEETDTWMRFLVVRMLLWAETPDVLAELGRQAELPLSDLQSPMRAVVLQYAVRHLGRAEALKEKYWKLVEEDPQLENGLSCNFGTQRQHILYALCTARDESKKNREGEFKVMRDTLTAVFNYDRVDLPAQSFTPLDQHWAIRGAAEYVSNMKTAVETITQVYPDGDLIEEKMERLMDWRCNHDRKEMNEMRKKWRLHIIDCYNLVGEMCTMQKQFALFNNVVIGMVAYTRRDSDEGRVPNIYPDQQMLERATNFNNLFSRKVADIFNDAIEGKEVTIEVNAAKRQKDQ